MNMLYRPLDFTYRSLSRGANRLDGGSQVLLFDRHLGHGQNLGVDTLELLLNSHNLVVCCGSAVAVNDQRRLCHGFLERN